MHQIASNFFEAFKNKDYKAMQACYHDEAQFSDPAFGTLNAKEVKAMWQMLLSRSEDLTVEYRIVQANTTQAKVEWIATYSFSATKRKVKNIVHSLLQFKDNKIISHKDTFDLWKWSAMALGISGTLLGWTPFLKNQIRKKATESLQKFINSTKPEL